MKQFQEIIKEICTVCGCHYSTRHFLWYPSINLYSGPFKVRMPACNSCASVWHDTMFRVVFDFPVGTDIKIHGDRACP